MAENPPEVFSEYAEIKSNLNYEILLGRQVDRCLYYRTTDPMQTFFKSVQALDMSLVDLPGKLLRYDFDGWVKEQQVDRESYPDCTRNEMGLRIYDAAFKEITRILSKYHLLFKSTTIEINR